MNLDAQWIVGFTDGEGCFHVGISSHADMTLGFQVLPEFVIVQHKRDVAVLHAIKDFFGCGVVRTNHGDRMCFRVRKLEHLNKIVIPFFEKHLLKTRKRQDFLIFRDVVRLMNERVHVNEEGLARIRAMVGRLEKSGKEVGQGKVQPSVKSDGTN
jgi:LAGLIDADG endonuclease